MRNVGILSEATLNAVKAALDERVARLEAEAERLTMQYRTLNVWPEFERSEDMSRAIIWTNDAIMETRAAQEVFAEVRDEPEHPADATPESELRYAWGDR